MNLNLNDLRVREWMTAPVPAISPRTTIATALRLLREQDAAALPVLDGVRFHGFVDERSLLRFTPSEATTLDVYEIREFLDKMTVARAVSPAAVEVGPETPLGEAAAAMRRAEAAVLPVVDGGRLIGLLPWTKVLDAVAAGSLPAAAGDAGGGHGRFGGAAVPRAPLALGVA